jgi:sugar/nucleoside kinase (ribokinase family)
VGNDFAGSAVEILLRREQIPFELETDPLRPTSLGIALTPAGMDKISMFLKGASQQTQANDIRRAKLSQSDLLHFGYPTSMPVMFEKNGDELLRFLQNAKENNVTCSLDMSLPSLDSEAGRTDWRPILERILPLVDIFVPSCEESFFMLHRDRYIEKVGTDRGENFIESVTDSDVREIADEFLDMGAKIVLIKAGAKGLYLRTAQPAGFSNMGRAMPEPAYWCARELWQLPVYAEQIVSATGAGDVAIAGFLASFLSGGVPEDALHAATIAAHYCLQSADTSGKLLPLEAMLLDAEKSELRYEKVLLPSGYWKDSSADGIFYGMHDKTIAGNAR